MRLVWPPPAYTEILFGSIDMSIFGSLFGGGSSKSAPLKKPEPKYDPKAFAPKQKQKDPDSNRSNKFGPKKD